MRKILLMILALSGATALFAQEKFVQVGLAYTNTRSDFQGTEQGGLAQISMFASKGIFRFGGYGDFLLTSNAYLGGGGLQLGIGCDAFNSLQFALLGKAGLGGGVIGGEAGAYYKYGGEFLAILRNNKNPGIGIFFAHDEIRNLIKLDCLNKNTVGYTSLGIKLSFRVIDSRR